MIYNSNGSYKLWELGICSKYYKFCVNYVYMYSSSIDSLCLGAIDVL